MAPSNQGRTGPAITWVLTIVLAVAFLGAGGAKLAGAGQMKATFGHYGLAD